MGKTGFDLVKEKNCFEFLFIFSLHKIERTHSPLAQVPVIVKIFEALLQVKSNISKRNFIIGVLYQFGTTC